MSAPSFAPKSPFLVIEDFINPDDCDGVIAEFPFGAPTRNEHTNAFEKTELMSPFVTSLIEDQLVLQGPIINSYFNVELDDLRSVTCERYPSGWKTPVAAPEGHAKGLNGWIKTADVDLFGVVFLTQAFSHAETFDPNFNVMGGNFEFPNFQFGFKPEPGTLVVYPSAPNFASAITAVKLGELYMLRIRMSTRVPYTYQPHMFPGKFTDWFAS